MTSLREVRQHYADNMTADCYLNIQEGLESVKKWSRPYDITGIYREPRFRLREDYLDHNLKGNGVFIVQHGKDGFWVGIFKANDVASPSLKFERKMQTREEVNDFLLDLHAQEGLKDVLTHPLQQRIPEIPIPEDLNTETERYYQVTGKQKPF
jgi:hypothetical protein